MKKLKKKIIKLQMVLDELCEAVESRPNYYICYEYHLNMKDVGQSEYWWLKDKATDEGDHWSQKNLTVWSNTWEDFEQQCLMTIEHESLDPMRQ